MRRKRRNIEEIENPMFQEMYKNFQRQEQAYAKQNIAQEKSHERGARAIDIKLEKKLTRYVESLQKRYARQLLPNPPEDGSLYMELFSQGETTLANRLAETWIARGLNRNGEPLD